MTLERDRRDREERAERAERDIDTGQQLARIETKIDSITNNLLKLFYLLIGIIAATVGVEFIGSPPWVIVSAYMMMIAGGFLLASLIGFWSTITVPIKLVMLSFIFLICMSILPRMFIYEPGVEACPDWVLTGVNITYVATAIAFMNAIRKKT